VPAPERIGYDTLIVAGSHYSYFGHEDWRMHAAEVKSLESALAVAAASEPRRRCGGGFRSTAELRPDPASPLRQA
jgi:hypothetical protein